MRDEHPFYYYFIAPGKYLVRLIGSSSTHRMFGYYSKMNPALRPFRFAVDCSWWGLEACFLGLLLRRGSLLCRSPALALVVFVIAYFYGMYAFAFGMNDFRYLVPVAPLVVLGVVCLMEGKAETAQHDRRAGPVSIAGGP